MAELQGRGTASPVAVDVAIDKAVELLAAARSVAVAGHVDPDGDALGSVFALTAALRHRGVEAIPTWGSRHDAQPPAPLEPALSFLPGAHDVRHPQDLPATIDVMVCCDTAAASRLGTAESVLRTADTVVVVDHHAVGDGFGDIRVVDPTASCTGILTLRLVDALGVPVHGGIADALYLALLTDTGRFGYGVTTPADHHMAARLLAAGADHVRINRAVYESASRGYLQLVSQVTARAVFDDDMVASWVTQDDLARTGTAESEPDGLIDLLRKIDDVDVVCFLRQTAAGVWRSSLRSRGAHDVAEVARHFGGGGHRLAAGFTTTGEAEEVLAEVRRQLTATGSRS